MITMVGQPGKKKAVPYRFDMLGHHPH